MKVNKGIWEKLGRPVWRAHKTKVSAIGEEIAERQVKIGRPWVQPGERWSPIYRLSWSMKGKQAVDASGRNTIKPEKNIRRARSSTTMGNCWTKWCLRAPNVLVERRREFFLSFFLLFDVPGAGFDTRRYEELIDRFFSLSPASSHAVRSMS